jgi:hypothetical protein
MARAAYWLTPPTRLTFMVSVVLVILALLVRYAHVSIPVVSAHVFETLLIGYLVLLVGNLFRGLRCHNSMHHVPRAVLSEPVK